MNQFTILNHHISEITNNSLENSLEKDRKVQYGSIYSGFAVRAYEDGIYQSQ